MKETPEKGSDKVAIHKFILLAVMLTATLLSGCSLKDTVHPAQIPIVTEFTAAPETAFTGPWQTAEGKPGENPQNRDSQQALDAYDALLAGNTGLLDETQLEQWWIPDFSDGSMNYEHTCMDLDGDGIPELVVQLKGDPQSYHGVFHFADGRLTCWNSDAAEMSCWDQLLSDGAIVRQTSWNGVRAYSIFRYRSNGETEVLSQMSAREELLDETSTDPCPYYEIDGEAVSQAAFEDQVAQRITSQLFFK